MENMSTLFTGYQCWVRFTTGIGDGTAQLQSNNEAGLKDGAKIGILFNGRLRLFKVEIKDYECEKEEDKKQSSKIVLLSNKVGNAEFVSTYWKGSRLKFFVHQVVGTGKARWSLATTSCTILGAFGAAVNSAQSATCSGIHCLTPLSRLLIGFAAVAALIGWMKENLS